MTPAPISRSASSTPILPAVIRSPRVIVAVLAVLAVLLATAQAAAAATPQARIIGGGPTTQAWPAQAAVRIDGTFCGGTLVSARWVVTAGHCAKSLKPGAYTVHVGSTQRTDPPDGHSATVDKVIRHPGFIGGTEPRFDLLLLHLTTAVPEQPMRLIGTDATENSLWSPGSEATVLGWGYDSNDANADLVPTLLEAKMPIVTDSACSESWGSRFDPALMVCASRPQVDTCSGDSGGPLMVRRREDFSLAGVTSWGTKPCAEPGYHGVYVRLGDPAINAWVKSAVPSVSFTTSPTAPQTGESVTLTGVASAGAAPAFIWDTDGDGTFDVLGPSVTLSFPSARSYVVGVKANFPDADSSATARDIVTVADPPPPPPPPSSSPSTPPPPFAAKLEILRATVARADRRLSVLAPITARASGEVRAAFQAAGRTERFGTRIDARNRRVRINRRIPAAQANLGTGILTLTYGGDGDTQPQEVRLRAASRPAGLKATRPRISNGRLIASGEISRRARGVVRLQLLFEPAGEQTTTVEFTAPISNGRYRFNAPLPADVRAGIAQRRGVVHSYTLFTGYFATRIRGEMRSFEVLGAR